LRRMCCTALRLYTEVCERHGLAFAAARADVEVVGSLVGSEVRCGRCGGHLGDVFSDGARYLGTRAEVTGRRYCIDGAALVFVPSDESAGPVAGDGLTGRARLPPVRRAGGVSMCAAPPGRPPADKQMSRPDELVVLAEVTDDFRKLMEAALVKLDKRRRLEGKLKYGTVEGMIDAYVDEAQCQMAPTPGLHLPPFFAACPLLSCLVPSVRVLNSLLLTPLALGPRVTGDESGTRLDACRCGERGRSLPKKAGAR